MVFHGGDLQPAQIVTQRYKALEMAVAKGYWYRAKYLKLSAPSRAILLRAIPAWPLGCHATPPKREGNQRSEGSPRRVAPGQSGRRRSADKDQRRRQVYAMRPQEQREVPGDGRWRNASFASSGHFGHSGLR